MSTRVVGGAVSGYAHKHTHLSPKPEPQILNPQPSTPNPKPSTPNPKP
jgi:hypothetical protein